MQDQDRIAELERRISAAIGRIGSGVEQLSIRADAAQPGAAPERVKPSLQTTTPAPPVQRSDGAEIARLERALREKDSEILRLREAVAAEKASVSELSAKLRAARDREAASAPGAMEAKVEKMTRQLDVQGLELQRMRKTTIQLREHLRVLHEAAAEGLAEPHLVNKAMLAELEALRAARHLDLAEVDEILAELEPLIEEARAHG